MSTPSNAGSRPPDGPTGSANVPGSASGASAAVLGMRLFILSLSMLFAAGVLGYLVIRSRADEWLPAGMPALPRGLWLSTLAILLLSATIHRAGFAARCDRQGELAAFLAASLALGLLFLALQTVNWITLVHAGVTARSSFYGFTFYGLTGLHAAHVIGGLIPLALVARNAARGRYTRYNHDGVNVVAMYWHFLDVVWIVLFLLMLTA